MLSLLCARGAGESMLVRNTARRLLLLMRMIEGAVVMMIMRVEDWRSRLLMMSRSPAIRRVRVALWESNRRWLGLGEG